MCKNGQTVEPKCEMSKEYVNFSKKNLEKLKGVPLGAELLNHRAVKEVNSYAGTLLTDQQKVSMLSACFEINFAYRIHAANLSAEYEFKTGMGNGSVDFKINGNIGEKNWLCELTCSQESEATKECKTEWVTNGIPYQGYNSEKCVSSAFPNSGESRDIMKIQRALLYKTFNKKPIKFPDDTECYHAIVINVDAFCGGGADDLDCLHAAYGGEAVPDYAKRRVVPETKTREGTECRSDLIHGIFQKKHPFPTEASHLQKTLDIIVFVGTKLEDKYLILPNCKYEINQSKEIKSKFLGLGLYS